MSRVRTKRVSDVATYYQRNDVSGPTGNFSFGYYVSDQTFTDDRLKPWDPSNPKMGNCSNSKVERKHLGTASYEWKYTSNSSWRAMRSGTAALQFVVIGGYPGLTFSTVNTSAVRQFVLMRAVANVDKTPYSFAEDLATFRETLKFISNPIATLADLALNWNKVYRNIIKGKGSTRRAKLIANAWAEYRFAFSPLLQSVHDALESIDLGFEAKVTRERRTYGTSHSSKSFTDVQGGTRNSPAIATLSLSGFQQIDVHATVNYRVSNPVYTNAWKYGVRVNDFPRLMWDLVPLSFMVDRLVDIGSSIRAITVLGDPNLEILGACTSVKNVQSVVTTIQDWPITDWTKVKASTDSAIQVNTQYDRYVENVSVSSVLPRVTPGGLIDTSTKLADLVALTVQRLRG